MPHNTAIDLTSNQARFLCSCLTDMLVEFGELPPYYIAGAEEERISLELQDKLNAIFGRGKDEFLKQYVNAFIKPNRIQANSFFKTIFGDKFEEMRVILSGSAVESAELGIRQIITSPAFQAARPLMDTSSLLLSRTQSSLLATRSFQASASTMQRLTGDVLGVINKAIDVGAGQAETAKLLESVFDGMPKSRLKLIARQEVLSFKGEGRHNTVRNVANKKKWITSRDDRVRNFAAGDEADHVRLHGEIKKVNEPFSNGLMFPGDRSGRIEEWINCRCDEVPEF